MMLPKRLRWTSGGIDFVTGLHAEVTFVGAANIKLEITGEDLRIFSDELINRAINEVALAFRAADEERLLSREEVKDMCGVCDATLWHWNKRNYLKAVKVGSKVRYRLSDVKRILGGTNKVGSNGGK